MFRSFFSALTNLTTTVNTLAASFTEANARLRENLALDYNGGDEPEQLEHQPAANGRGRKQRS